MSTCDKTRHSAGKIETIVLSSLQKQLEIFQSLSKVLEEEEEKNKTSISSIRKDLERELEKLKAERIRQYEAYAEGVTGREEYLSEKKVLSEKIEKMQTRYEQLNSITTEEDALMEDIKKVRENAEEVNILKKMTRQVAEEFVEEIIIYDSKQMEIKFVFDDLLAEIANRVSKKKTEEIA